jgi:succinoglycan biosynthesis transport protein ExoP
MISLFNMNCILSIDTEVDMEFKEFLEVLRKRIKALFITALIFIFAGCGTSLFVLPKVYEASATLIVSKPSEQIIIDEIIANQRLVKSYSLIAKSERVLSRVISELGLNFTTKELQPKVSVHLEADTEIIQIAVEDKSPERAQKIANTLVHIFPNEVKEILNMDNVQVVDYATLPIKPIRPNLVLNTVMSLFAGLFAGILIVSLQNYFDSTIKSQEDIQEHMDIPVLGTIPKASWKGKRKRINELLMESYILLGANADVFNPGKEIKTILVTSEEFSEGKTCTAVNLAISLANFNQDVLLLDGDLRKPSLNEIFLEKTDKILKTFSTRNGQQYTIRSVVDVPNLAVMTGQYKGLNPLWTFESGEMESLIKELSKDYDRIIIDSPPVLLVPDPLVLSGFADGVLIVTKYGSTGIELLKKTVGRLQAADAIILGAIINYVPIKLYSNLKYYRHIKKSLDKPGKKKPLMMLPSNGRYMSS